MVGQSSLENVDELSKKSEAPLPGLDAFFPQMFVQRLDYVRHLVLQHHHRPVCTKNYNHNHLETTGTIIKEMISKAYPSSCSIASGSPVMIPTVGRVCLSKAMYA